MQDIKDILEALLFASAQPLDVAKLIALFPEYKRPEAAEVKQALLKLQQDYANRSIELVEVASGYRFQVRDGFSEWVERLFEEKAPRYSRALLETLVLIAYRQPITRAEIEDVRGVSVSTHLVKVLLEREWVRVVGYRDVPGRPALYATTRQFLDYFNLKSLKELPPFVSLPESVEKEEVEEV